MFPIRVHGKEGRVSPIRDQEGLQVLDKTSYKTWEDSRCLNTIHTLCTVLFVTLTRGIGEASTYMYGVGRGVRWWVAEREVGPNCLSPITVLGECHLVCMYVHICIYVIKNVVLLE